MDLFAAHSKALINQFPYEAAIIRKDMLPQTLRQYWAREKLKMNPDSGTGILPPWYPATYDLATEVQWFSKAFQEVSPFQS